MVFVTKTAMCKIVDGKEFDVAKRTVAATKLMDDDEVVSVTILNEQNFIVLQTKEGLFSRFSLAEIPEKKKAAVGVRGMKLEEKDYIENVYYTLSGSEQVIKYKNKKIDLNKLKLGKRDTKGVKVRTS